MVIVTRCQDRARKRLTFANFAGTNCEVRKHPLNMGDEAPGLRGICNPKQTKRESRLPRMKNKSDKILQRGDRALVGALLIVLAICVAREVVCAYRNYIDLGSGKSATTHMADAKTLSVAPKPTPIEVAAEQLLAQRRCLAEAMYYEARGEGAVGEMAIAEVIFHRMRSSLYPNTICGVVFEGAQDKRACQFSFVCNGDMERPKNPHAWAVARLLAAKIMTGAVRLGDITENATSYHAVSVDPRWAASLQKTVQIGNHIFYRPRTRSRGT